MEHKTLSLNSCELKTEGDAGTVKGYAAVFNGVDSYGDTILKGAFEKTLKKNGMPKMFLMHDSYDLPIGRWSVAEEDDKGLRVEGELTLGIGRAADTYAALKHQTLDGLSIGYMLSKGDYEPSDKMEGGRIIRNVSVLLEVSPVVFPADRRARISAVKTDQAMAEIGQMETIRDFECFLRDAGGMSKGLTEALVSRAKVVFGRGDPAEGVIDAKAAQELSDRLARFESVVSGRFAGLSQR
jgi:HK97 family phage prohead protease